MKKVFTAFVAALTLVIISAQTVFANEAAHEAVDESLPLWSIIPFVRMLLSIAIFPLVKAEWWEKNQLWVALA